ncbi:MAG TPA: xylulokinase, partial [Solirubrobacteraceae bacterium]
QDGTVAARASRGYPLHTPRPGWSEQDPDDWWRAASEVLDELRARAGAPVGIGLSGQMHGLVALDAADRPLRPAILWNDQRCQAECDEIEERIGFERLIRLTGNRALTGFTAPKLLWLGHHEPEIYERIASVLLPKDYVRLRLCGEHACDVSDASGTLLFDVASRTWSRPVISELGIPADWLPRVLESAERSGETADGVPVAAGAGDQAAGALGVGVLASGPVSVVIGTSGVVFAALGRYAPDPQARTHTFCHGVPNTWHAMGVMLSAAGSLEWLRATLGGREDFDTLLAEAAVWEPGAEGVIFLPYLAGERTPHADPDARAAFVGLTLRHDRGALVRAVLEGVAFGLRDCLDVLIESGASASEGIASGGGASSELWLRIAAAAFGMPLSRTSVSDGAAFGAALLGGVVAGVWEDVQEAVGATVTITDTIEPDPVWVERYTELQAAFRGLYPAIRHAQPISEEVTK